MDAPSRKCTVHHEKVQGLDRFLRSLAIAVGGAWASQFFSRKFFLEDFNAMNGFYKLTLFLTGKDEREKAVSNCDRLLPACAAFQNRCTAWQAFALRGAPSSLVTEKRCRGCSRA